jgi:hypothetical protein
MSVQFFLQGKLVGIEDYLLAPLGPGGEADGCGGERLILGRARWVRLLTEVLPRALLAKLGLARLLLGSSGGGQFLVGLPEEVLPEAGRFLEDAARDIERLSGGHLRLVTAATENLGEWSVVRKRLAEEMSRRRGTPAAAGGDAFAPAPAAGEAAGADYFLREMGAAFQAARSVGWSPESPGKILCDGGLYTWPVGSGPSPDGIAVARHAAVGGRPAPPPAAGGPPAAGLRAAATAAGLYPARGRARQEVAAGGLSVNNVPVRDAGYTLSASDLLPGGYVILRKGKKHFHVLRVATE